MKDSSVIEPEGFLDLGDARLEYRWVGPLPAEAPTIVLLHEGLGSVSMWRDFPELLAAALGVGVFAYSRSGYGRSTACTLPRPVTYMHEEAQAVLPAVLDAIGFRGGILFGHSDGASIAAIYAGSHRDDRVWGVAMMAPHFFTEDMCIAEIAAAKTVYETTDLRQRLARHHGDNVDVAFWGWNRTWLDPAFRQWDIRAFLRRIEVPVLAFQGADDQYATAAQITVVEDLCPGPVDAFLLADCRHSPHRDQPERTLAAVSGFFGRVAQGRDEAHRHGARNG